MRPQVTGQISKECCGDADSINMYVTGLLPGGPICGKGKDDLNHDPHGVTGGVSAYYILHITGH